MSTSSKKLFTSGEFAALCNVKKQTLFHYDEIGLLSPEVKKENGYRYYSYYQYGLFSVIEMLKQLKMPLQEIKDYLQTKSPQQLMELLTVKSREINQQIEDLQRLQTMIQTKHKQTRDALQTDYSQITIEYMLQERLLISKKILHCTDPAFLEAISVFHSCLKEMKVDSGHPIGGMIRRKEVLEGDYDNYYYLYNRLETIPTQTITYVKAAGLYVIGYHIGRETTIDQTYAKLLNYIQKEDLKLGNWTYEEYILDEISVNGIDHYVTKIVIEVREK
ncbi:MerR family transcriptional regulator [Virgibacillus halodenitrificans]|uniref:MerR family transcriptional regulator n=1 Tax=Virgibacillus halodenitrificans TaxID=1482 RepID=UPI0024C0D114|nr:MerR family transcriptional regulator [Virgibacillus halodenitrificans]WHX25100.1 MerR family transcriptional regulator [Virgibacillus halodenitrificans]